MIYGKYSRWHLIRSPNPLIWNCLLDGEANGITGTGSAAGKNDLKLLIFAGYEIISYAWGKFTIQLGYSPDWPRLKYLITFKARTKAGVLHLAPAS